MEIFKKILPEEREVIFQEASNQHALIVFRTHQKVVRTNILSLRRPNYLTCLRPPDLVSLKAKDEVVVVMVLGDERFFFKSVAFVDDNLLFLSRKVDLFHLVRRKTKRIKIPDTYEGTLMIKKINNDLSFLRGTLFDFSDTGCRVGLVSEIPKIFPGAELLGTLKLGDRRALELSGTVRHAVTPKTGNMKQVFGVKFNFENNHQKSVVKDLFIELQREVFSQKSDKK